MYKQYLIINLLFLLFFPFNSVLFCLGDSPVQVPTSLELSSSYSDSMDKSSEDLIAIADTLQEEEEIVSASVGESLKIYSVSDELIYTSIPDEYKEFISLEFGNEELITVDDKILIKGKNTLGGKVFINSEDIYVDNDGNFSYVFNLNDYGKDSVFISFTTLDNKFLCIQKNINYLFQPEDISKYKGVNQNLIYFYNNDLFYDIKNKALSSKITRADLAYFLTRIKKDDPSKQRSYLNDVKQADWFYPYISNALNSHLMGEFPDGSFYPDKTVSFIELYVSLVRVFDFSIEDQFSPLGISSLSDTHWSARFIRAALDNGLILDQTNVDLSQTVSLVDFINIVSRVYAVQEEYRMLVDHDAGYDVDEYDLFYKISPVLTFLKKNEILVESSSSFELKFPLNKDVFFMDEVTFNGRIFPPQNFEFFYDVITTNVKGDFSFVWPLDEGVNDFSYTVLDVTQNITLYKLLPYQDLKGHWINELSAKLMYLGFLEEVNLFEPKMELSRKDFVTLLTPFLLESTVEESSVTISDVVDDTDQIQALKFLIYNGIFSLDENDSFYPEKPLKRIEALAAIVRYIDLIESDTGLKQNSSDFPFWDVPSHHWGRSYVERAYGLSIISKNYNFYPNKIITKDECVAMLSKLTHVQDLLNQHFDDKK
ncbi:hypothetical protein DID78_00135 [Candidatus Marinamargulisbacteria bacterium SCGC AG-343-D04]|nr:hypothetical protein DID78_00135 [Candidatus Marinamargulisbacteria bacterium SCGC AG-343-D04]